MITTFSIRPNYTTGQSLMFDTLNAELRSISSLEVIELPSGKPGLIYFLPVFQKFISAVYSSKLIIITGSRSFRGFLREVPFYLVCLLLRKKVVFYNHGADLVSLLNRPFALWLFRKLKIYFILPTDYLLPPILVAYGFDYFVLRNPSLLTRKKLDEIVKHDTYIYVGNFVNGKGQVKLLEMLEMNREVVAPIDLKFYGSIKGVDLKTRQLKSFKQFYGGQLNALEINKLYNSSSTLVFLSNYSVEYNPLVVIDALFMGMNLILLDTPVLRAAVADYPRVYWMSEITLEQWNNAINWTRANADIGLDGLDYAKYSKEKYAGGVKSIISKLIEVA